MMPPEMTQAAVKSLTAGKALELWEYYKQGLDQRTSLRFEAQQRILRSGRRLLRGSGPRRRGIGFRGDDRGKEATRSGTADARGRSVLVLRAQWLDNPAAPSVRGERGL